MAMGRSRAKGRGSVEVDIYCAEREIKAAEEVIRWGTLNLNAAKEKLAIAKEMQRRTKLAQEIMNAPYKTPEVDV